MIVLPSFDFLLHPSCSRKFSSSLPIETHITPLSHRIANIRPDQSASFPKRRLSIARDDDTEPSWFRSERCHSIEASKTWSRPPEIIQTRMQPIRRPPIRRPAAIAASHKIQKIQSRCKKVRDHVLRKLSKSPRHLTIVEPKDKNFKPRLATSSKTAQKKAWREWRG